jgi:DNA-binding Lrp family transcriptional regulator
MDELDKRILDVIQSGFPIAARPYAEVGRMVGADEAEVLARVRALRESGVVRRIGANFQSRRLGWHSTLCGARVPAERLEAFVAEVNRHPGVTHNYLRAHEFNVWFTYIGPDKDAVQKALAGMSERTGVHILYLPAETLFKIKVDFRMGGDAEGEA